MGILDLLPPVRPVLLGHIMDILIGHGADGDPVHGIIHVLPEIRHGIVHIRYIHNALVIGITELDHRGHEIDDQDRQGDDDDKGHGVQSFFQGKAV